MTASKLGWILILGALVMGVVVVLMAVVLDRLGWLPSAESEPDERLKRRRRRELARLDEEAQRLGLSLEEVAAAPDRAAEIVGAFARVLETAPARLRPESLLPYPRAVVEEALRAVLSTTHSSGQLRQAILTGLAELNSFVPDAEMPSDPQQSALEYVRRRIGGGR